VRRLPAGRAVGYGRTFITARESLVGLVPIGYGDGYRRLLGNDSLMTLDPIRDRRRVPVPVIGRISMDQTTVDLTEAGDVRVGDPVTIIDDDPAAPHSVESLARKLSTIPYEITCLVGPRVQRVAV
jgi:alanine racemase